MVNRTCLCLYIATFAFLNLAKCAWGDNVMPNEANMKTPPAFECVSGSGMRFAGAIGDRIAANQRNWLLTAPTSNPAMLQMFLDRDRTPARELLPWSGEFAGKYLTSAVECYRLTGDPILANYIKDFVKELIATQTSNGYMGPFPKSEQMIGKDRWDLWGQYHCMMGLYLWYREVGDKEAFAACRRTADYFCKFFLDGGHRVKDAGSEEMNESCIHIFTLLYEETGEPRYLQLAKEIEKDFEAPPSGDYIRESLKGKEFYQLPKPRWEGLHAVQAISELYFITGDERYRKAYEQIWWSIDELDRHNTGGFSAGEQAQGNPYHQGGIETCCTIAWMAVTVDMLRMTGDSRVADELELSTFNNILGAQEPNGRWWTYNTPMDGERRAATQDINFQERPGSPELSCCSVNAPRGLGMLSKWAVMSAKDGVVLNYYGPSEFVVKTPSKAKLRIVQKTDYPLHGQVAIAIKPEKSEQFKLYLRIPSWSRSTKVILNGSPIDNVKPGNYLIIDRKWKSNDKIELTFDMSTRLWVGERECANKVSIYHGPLLMAYDPRFDSYDPTSLPIVDLSKPAEQVSIKGNPKPILLLKYVTKDGKEITLCDFASAGMAGNRYVSWLPESALKAVEFTRDSPMRASWDKSDK